jgi:hypothetical protein
LAFPNIFLSSELVDFVERSFTLIVTLLKPTMESSSNRTEAELEQFRQQWREEVSARNKKPTNAREAFKAQDNAPRPARQRTIPTASSSTAKRKDIDYSEELEPRAYHDLPDKEAHLKLGVDGQDHDRHEAFREPESALEHYERAVERETQGNLGESMKHYRIAFKVRLSFPVLEPRNVVSSVISFAWTMMLTFESHSLMTAFTRPTNENTFRLHHS